LNYRWDNPYTIYFWDFSSNGGEGREFRNSVSDKILIQNPAQTKYENVLAAMGRVVEEIGKNIDPYSTENIEFRNTFEGHLNATLSVLNNKIKEIEVKNGRD